MKEPINSKETSYLKLIRPPSSADYSFNEDMEEIFENNSFYEKMKWRGIKLSTAIISLIAFSTIVFAAVVLLSAGIISLL